MSLTEGKLPQNSAEQASPDVTPKRVLVVSYYWPPSGGGGVQRWLKFAKILPEHGWQPVVVTPSNPDVPVTDSSLVSEVSEETEVWPFPVWEPSRFLRRLGIGRSSSRLGSDAGARPSLLARVIRWVRGNLFVPDARAGWVKPTTKGVLQKLQDAPVDLIVTTGPPHSVHLIGLALKRATGLPWVADFRDPWSTMDYLDDFGLSTRTRQRIQTMEREVVREADRIVVTSPGALRELGVGDPAKGAVLPNGWDRDDFPESPEPPVKRKRPVLGHFGALYGARNPKDLWPTLAQSGWSFHAGGPISDDVLRDIQAANMDFQWRGLLPHREAVMAMRSCDALVVVHNDSPSARSSTPGKVFECLATGLPLLVIGPHDGDLEALCRTWGVTYVAHGDEGARVDIGAWLKNPLSPPDKSLRHTYERHAISAELADLFNTLVS